MAFFLDPLMTLSLYSFMLCSTLTWSYLPSLNTARQLHSMGIFQGISTCKKICQPSVSSKIFSMTKENPFSENEIQNKVVKKPLGLLLQTFKNILPTLQVN
jgi:hypothetical protein